MGKINVTFNLSPSGHMDLVGQNIRWKNKEWRIFIEKMKEK